MIPKPPRPVLQRGHPLARGLLNAWPLWERGGVDVRDLVRARTLTATALSWGKGPAGAYINCSTMRPKLGAQTPPPAAVTFSLLARPRVGYSGFNNLFTWLDSGDPFYVQIGWLPAGTLSFVLAGPNGTAGYIQIISTAVQALNTWVRVDCAYDGTGTTYSALEMYWNGVAQATTGNNVGTFTGPSQDASTIMLGGQLDGSWPLAGDIADCKVWSRKLSAREIAAHYADPWALYRAPSRVVRGVQAAAFAPWLPVVTSRRVTR